MDQIKILPDGTSVRVRTFHTVIIGSGAAGWNAADCLIGSPAAGNQGKLKAENIAVITENSKAGTSRNTGSDKQTYYKLSLSGSDSDSVRLMARTLFSGGSVDGDTALCEAASSTECFYKLVQYGIPFPQNHFGEYIGYKTDHDPYRRATSAGPYTSRMMTESLENSVRNKGVSVFDGQLAVRILTDPEKTRVRGVLCLNLDLQPQKISNTQGRDHFSLSTQDNGNQKSTSVFTVYFCQNVILATGGPAGIYADTVYPVSQHGSSSLAYEAGVRGQNLTEWQYGLASISPRWNVSGTYMQALPRFISTKKDRTDPREFLYEEISDPVKIMELTFHKGYEWPFDIRKIQGGSSLLDVLVYQETKVRGRRVFLDFTTNSMRKEIDFSSLCEETRSYLMGSHACFGTPVERLRTMNEPAYQFYLEKGIDLSKEPLEIALCAQHCNGGISVDEWWQTSLGGLFAVGEAAGTHGVYRPGGTALNAGQVGSLRAAEYILHNTLHEPGICAEQFWEETEQWIQETAALRMGFLRRSKRPDMPTSAQKDQTETSQAGSVHKICVLAADRMSQAGAVFREKEAVSSALKKTEKDLEYTDHSLQGNLDEVPAFFILRDILITQIIYLSAMKDYIAHGGKSRGSALYQDPAGSLSVPYLNISYTVDDGSFQDTIQTVYIEDQEDISCISKESSFRRKKVCRFIWREVRPIPPEPGSFEMEWKQYREGKYFPVQHNSNCIKN